MPPFLRLKIVSYIFEIYGVSSSLCRDIEAAIHASVTSLSGYREKTQQILHNLSINPSLAKLGSKIVCMTNSDMSRGTVLEDIETESKLRKTRFEAMLQNKYDQTNDTTCRTTLKCRRCGSSEVQVEQKQTRGADEAMTLFCTCSKCTNRWTMR